MTEQEQADALWMRVYEAVVGGNSAYMAVDRADEARRTFLERHERAANYQERARAQREAYEQVKAREEAQS